MAALIAHLVFPPPPPSRLPAFPPSCYHPGVGVVAVIGLVVSAGCAVFAAALFVRLRFTRVASGVANLPLPLFFYHLWMGAWFVFECLRQFLMTSVAPPTSLRLAAVVLLFASFCCLAWVYDAISVVHQFIANRASRRVRRGARHAALLCGALLIFSWSAFHYGDDSSLFILMRGTLGMAALPLALGAWVWLFMNVRARASGEWRDALLLLTRGYLGLFGAMFVLTLARPFLGGRLAIVPAAADIVIELVYAIGTAWWIEKQGERYQAIP